MSTQIIQAPDLKHDAMMLKRFGTVVSANGKLERRIVANLCAHLEREGFKLFSVYDGEEETRVKTATAAMELIFNLDEAWLYAYKDDTKKRHYIFLVLGNGIDIIADWNYTEGDPDGFDAAMDKFDAEVFA